MAPTLRGAAERGDPPPAALVRNLALTGRCVVAYVSAGTGELLSRLDATTRARVLARAHSRLGQLTPRTTCGKGEIICAVATKGTGDRSEPDNACAAMRPVDAAVSRAESAI